MDGISAVMDQAHSEDSTNFIELGNSLRATLDGHLETALGAARDNHVVPTSFIEGLKRQGAAAVQNVAGATGQVLARRRREQHVASINALIDSLIQTVKNNPGKLPVALARLETGVNIARDAVLSTEEADRKHTDGKRALNIAAFTQLAETKPDTVIEAASRGGLSALAEEDAAAVLNIAKQARVREAALANAKAENEALDRALEDDLRRKQRLDLNDRKRVAHAHEAFDRLQSGHLAAMLADPGKRAQGIEFATRFVERMGIMPNALDATITRGLQGSDPKATAIAGDLLDSVITRVPELAPGPLGSQGNLFGLTVASLKRRGFADDEAVSQAKAMVITVDPREKARRAEAYAMDRREIERENERILNDALPKPITGQEEEESTPILPITQDDPASAAKLGKAGVVGKGDPTKNAADVAKDGSIAKADGNRVGDHGINPNNSIENNSRPPASINPAGDGDSVVPDYNQKVEHFYGETGDLDAARKAAGAAIRRGRALPFAVGGEGQTVGKVEAEDQLDTALLPIIDQLPKISDEDHRQSDLDLSRPENAFAFNSGRAIQAVLQSPDDPNPIDVGINPAGKGSKSRQQRLAQQTNREHNNMRLSELLAMIGGAETAEDNTQLAAFAAGLEAPLKFSMRPIGDGIDNNAVTANILVKLIEWALRRLVRGGAVRKGGRKLIRKPADYSGALRSALRRIKVPGLREIVKREIRGAVEETKKKDAIIFVRGKPRSAMDRFKRIVKAAGGDPSKAKITRVDSGTIRQVEFPNGTRIRIRTRKNNDETIVEIELPKSPPDHPERVVIKIKHNRSGRPEGPKP